MSTRVLAPWRREMEDSDDDSLGEDSMDEHISVELFRPSLPAVASAALLAPALVALSFRGALAQRFRTQRGLVQMDEVVAGQARGEVCPVGHCDRLGSSECAWFADQSFHCIVKSCLEAPVGAQFSACWGQSSVSAFYNCKDRKSGCAKAPLFFDIDPALLGHRTCERCPVGYCDRLGSSECAWFGDQSYHCVVASCEAVPAGAMFSSCWGFGGGSAFYSIRNRSAACALAHEAAEMSSPSASTTQAQEAAEMISPSASTTTGCWSAACVLAQEAQEAAEMSSPSASTTQAQEVVEMTSAPASTTSTTSSSRRSTTFTSTVDGILTFTFPEEVVEMTSAPASTTLTTTSSRRSTTFTSTVDGILTFTFPEEVVEMTSAPASTTLTTTSPRRSTTFTSTADVILTYDFPEVDYIWLPETETDQRRWRRMRKEAALWLPGGEAKVRRVQGVNPLLWPGGGSYDQVERWCSTLKPNVGRGAKAGKKWWRRRNSQVGYAEITPDGRTAMPTRLLHHTGCSLSHFILWMDARSRGLQHVLVAESDGTPSRFGQYAGFVEDFASVVVELMRSLPEGWDIIQLDKCRAGAADEGPVQTFNGTKLRSPYNVFRWLGGGQAGAALYLASRTFLDQVPKMIFDRGLDMVDGLLEGLCGLGDLKCFTVCSASPRYDPLSATV